jgi:hypothetical protein
MNDPIKRPAHYTWGTVETIDYIEQVVSGYPREIGYHVGNVLKYLSRAPHKGNLQQDLEKASWYLTRAINRAVKVEPEKPASACTCDFECDCQRTPLT